ncbi:aminotransferase [Fusibacter ferrireducens]|uniref:Aminotransferase n=1 Tax=Fusibacter ferrireducens TaxID=2785058 RepID=A0ABR9ZPQ4_9FIRM|nr:aminotransferase [Fusibacter ferrireducens]MBF4692452.1 aminotransferase [Fusibacter ferrireducens]
MKIKDFKVERWMDAYETKCEINVAESCVDSLRLDELLEICGRKEAFTKQIMEMKLTYGAIEGSDYLKRGIASLYKNVSASQITVTHGTIGANYLVLMSLIEPEDEVITILPTYQQHYSVPESIGAKVHKLYLDPQNGFLPDLKALRRLVNDKTKLISFSNPNNPTGASLDESMLKEIVEIASSVDAYVLSDEAYRGMNYEGERFTASIVDLYEKGISTSSMSKTFALAGLRIGWVCSNQEVIKGVNKVRDYNHISCSMIDDYIAAMALENKDKIIDRSVGIIKKNLEIVEAWLKENTGFSFVKPKAGPVIVLKYDLEMDSNTFCKRLLDEAHVLVVPGETLDIEGHFRVGIGNNSENLKEALNRIGRFYRNLSS